MSNTQIHPILHALRNVRASRGISQIELARRLGYDDAVVSGWETGKFNPKWESICNWCEALNAELIVRFRE
jgi:Predicted transcriptional regulator with C-terminal CBS domains